MIKVYTAGYMHGEGSDRPDWRADLRIACKDVFVKKYLHVGDFITWLNPGVPQGTVPGQGDPKLFGPRDVLQIQRCDVVIVYFDLDVARSMGAALAVGLAYALQKRIIMVYRCPDLRAQSAVSGNERYPKDGANSPLQ